MKYATILLLALFLSAEGLAQELNTITTAVPFLLITPDARAGGLGDAGCASTPDVYSNFHNSSKNIFARKKNGIAFSWTPWLRGLVPDINIFEFSSYKKIGTNHALGFSAKYFSLGNITFTDIVGNTVGQFRPYEHSESIFFSSKLSHNFSAGIAMRYIYSNLTGNITIANTQTHPGQSLAMDFSCYNTDTFNFIKSNDIFAWGINISNIGQKISYSDRGEKDFIPQNLKGGISYKIMLDDKNTLEVVYDINKLLVPTPPRYSTDQNGNPIMGANGQYVIQEGRDPDRSVFNALYSSFYDAPDGFKEELREINLSTGIEYWCYNTVAIRAGYFHEHATKGGRKYLTFGLGGKYKGIELDGAYLLPTTERHPLQNTMRFTLSWEFSTHKKNKTPNFVG